MKEILGRNPRRDPKPTKNEDFISPNPKQNVGPHYKDDYPPVGKSVSMFEILVDNRINANKYQ